MKRVLLYCTLVVCVEVCVTSCSTTATKIPKSVAYKQMYDEKPLTILLMPPINRSINVEAKEYFHSTLNVFLSNCGYYVIPPILSMDVLKKESAYDAEMFLNSSLTKFNDVFGADMVIFTIIDKWKKSTLSSKVQVKIEYIIKSTKTNQVLYARTGDITCDTSVSTGVGGLWGMAANMAFSALKTATTNYIDVAKACNGYTFYTDLPWGKYLPNYQKDLELKSNKKEFKTSITPDILNLYK